MRENDIDGDIGRYTEITFTYRVWQNMEEISKI